MNDAQVKELFGSLVAGGPADRLDVDRAITVGRRRRRRVTTATLVSMATVVALVMGVAFAIPRTSTPTPVGPSPTGSPTASPFPTAPVTGTVTAWGMSVESSLLYRDQITRGSFTVVPADGAPSGPDELSRSQEATASFHYTQGGRTTGLVVTAYAKGTYGARKGSASYGVQRACEAVDLACRDVRGAPDNPVLIQRGSRSVARPGAGVVSVVSASNVRPSGVVITVTSYGSDLDGNGDPVGVTGTPGMADDLERLIQTATDVPAPRLASDAVPTPASTDTWPPTPVSSPTAASPTVTVAQDRPHDVGSGATITLTTSSVCVTVPGRSAPSCQDLGGLGERDVSKDVVPLSGAGYVVFGRYPMSDAGVTSIVVTSDGRARLATLATWGPQDQHLAYYLVVPDGSLAGGGAATVEVYDASGHLMAQNLAS